MNNKSIALKYMKDVLRNVPSIKREILFFGAEGAVNQFTYVEN